jgi:hypothetical protein
VADNKYRGYLDEERQSNMPSLSGMAMIGGVGALVVSPRARGMARGAVRGVTGAVASGGIRAASYLNRGGRTTEMARTGMAFMKAMDHALDQRSPLSHLSNPGRLSTRFEDQMRRELQGLGRKGQTPFGGVPFAVEKRLDQLTYDLPMSANIYRRGVQEALSINELKKRIPQHFDNGLEGILKQQDDKFYLDPGHGKIQSLLAQYKKSNQAANNNAWHIDTHGNDQDFINQMFGTLKHFADARNIDPAAMRNGGLIDGVDTQGAANLAKSIKDGFIRDSQVKDDFASRVMNTAGYRVARVEDLLVRNENGIYESGLFEADSIQRTHGKRHKFGKSSQGSSNGFGAGSKAKGTTFDANLGRKLAAMANGKNGDEILGLAVDQGLFVNAAGDFKDIRGIKSGAFKFLTAIQENTQVPFLRFNPLDLMHWTTIQGIAEAPATYFFRHGTIQPALQGAAQTLSHPRASNQDAAAGTLAQDYMFSGGNIYDVVSGKLVKEDTYLASGRFGMIPRALASMANLHRQNYANRSVLGKLFDVGAQETKSVWSRMASTVTKFDDPNWARNRFRSIFQVNSGTQAGLDSLEASYKDLYADMATYASPLSDDTAAYINHHVQQAYGASNVDLTKMNTPKEVMDTLGRIMVGIDEKNGRLVSAEKGLGSVIGKMYGEYINNPTEFLKGKRVVSDHSPYMMGPVQAVDAHETKLVGQVADIRRLIHQHAIEQLESRAGITVGDLVTQGVARGELQQAAIGEVRDLNVLSKLHSYWDDIYKHPLEKEGSLQKFQSDLFNDDTYRTGFSQSVEEHAPLWAMGPGDKPPQPFGHVGFVAMNKARGHRWFLKNMNEQIQQGIEPGKALLSSAWGVLGQPFAGRKNLGDVTTATMPFYYMAERLDNTMAKFGGGLSQKNRGSMQSILANQFMRRIVLPYAAVQQAQWFDDMTGNIISDQASDTYANMTMDTAWLKDMTGLNQFGKEFGQLFAGSDQLWKTPIGGLIKYGSFGLLGDNRSEDEMRQYYEHGEDPIRKGRWWGVGSNTPWQGGQIDYYAPNWFRRQKSDYKMTDTLYGSKGEYWANTWVPTLSNPFAPIGRLLDPDHWANKHKDDRPYPVTGGIDELNMIPLIGGALNRTVGGVLNPYAERADLSKAHRAYQEEINAFITSQEQSNLGGGSIDFMPAGGFRVYQGGGGWAGGGGLTVGGGDGVAVDGTMIGGNGGMGNLGAYTRADLSSINASITNAGVDARVPARSIGSIDSLRDPDMQADLADYGKTYGAGGAATDLWYNATEMAGIYGFSANMFMGIDTNKRSMVLAHSSRMASYNRSFFDMEMGGADLVGGDFSEIFRRYVSRDVNQYYNPYRNKMPDWMPGVDYYTDFQHGDPYQKIKRGEMRLPGAAYETLNKLHPDQFGEYGAFDRFKILADAAPYSTQYRQWRKVVSQMNQQGILTPEEVDEYATIRDQVTNRKKKYNLYPRKFDNADVIKKDVTITRVIDANTFMTAEYDTPIKLAGVEVPSDATEVQEWLQQYIYEGAKVTIGLDADPLFRVRDDTMNTMRAVVYSNGNDDNSFYTSTRGQSVNSILANRSFGGFMGFGGNNPVKIKDDGSGVATAALFDKTQITVGKAWETLSHDILPNIPIMGTIFDKFMPVKSPLEHYKKNQVYGKDWRPWYDPWSGWIQPMFETMASNNPAVAAAQGYGTGWLVGRGKGRFYGKWIGAAVAGTLAGLRTLDEVVGDKLPGGDNYTWIPERRKKERAINEYFDILKYMKYRGLYERANQEAKEYEGIDVDTLLGNSKERGKTNKRQRRYLETAKKWLSISQKMGYVDDEVVSEQLDKVRDRLKIIDSDRGSAQVGPRTMQALQYKQEYESTLYGADPSGDFQAIFKALPSKDREYFSQFMTASPKEREEILRLVPKDQRRLYQSKWGMDVDKQESLYSYFTTHNLPGTDWEGWRPDINLDDIKYKVVRNEGIEATEFGLWGDDGKRSEQSGVSAVEPFRPSMLLDVSRIEKVLRGAGISDVNVTMTTSPADEHGLSVGFNLMKDRTEDIKQELKNNMGSIFA